MDLSIITTMYQSANFLKEFHQRMIATAEKLTHDFELIFVNDGSPDNSLEVALEIQKSDARVVIVDLSRNFGHHKAMMTGLSYAQGEKIFLIDCDLEEAPELLLTFNDNLQEFKCDVVYGVQAQRQDRWIDRTLANIYYTVVNFLSNIKLTRNLVTVRLMTKRYVQSLLLHREKEVNIASLWYITGYDQRALEIHKLSRPGTNYTLARKFAILVNTITAFSAKPLIYIFYLGLTISTFSFFYILVLIYERLSGNPISGWASVIVSIWFLGGITLFSIGIIGIYLSKIFLEIKARPYTIVRDVFKTK